MTPQPTPEPITPGPEPTTPDLIQTKIAELEFSVCQNLTAAVVEKLKLSTRQVHCSTAIHYSTFC
jgi:hypothetical protein